MKIFYGIVLGLLILTLSVPVLAQEHSGVVTDAETGNPLIGANVIVEGTMTGAATDADGRFSFTYSDNQDYTIVVSFVGYKTGERDISPGDNTSNLNFDLALDPFGLDEIVVTGIASKTSKAVAEIAVQRINMAELTEKTNFNSITDMLGGKVAGVTMQTSVGTFGAEIRFNMRSGGGLNGDGQPVFYIDGIKMENSDWRGGGNNGITSLTALNPEEIESIEIIKGPAGASSYGTGGSNGVVLITTKRGSLARGGAKSWTINYKGTVGYNDQAQHYGKDFFKQYELIDPNGDPVRSNLRPTEKWVNDYFTKGKIQKNAINLTGGTERVRLFASFERDFQKGHTRRSFMDKTSLRANFDYFPSDKFNVRISSSFVTTEIETPQRGRGGNTWGQIYFNLVPWSQTDSTPEYYAKRTDMNWFNDFTGSTTMEWMPFAGEEHVLKGLSGRITVGVNERDTRYKYLGLFTTEEETGNDSEGWNSQAQRHSRTLTYTSDVRYDYNLLGITASATVGSQLFDEDSERLSAAMESFSSGAISVIQAATEWDGTSESIGGFRSAGIFTEHSFSYDDTYFASFMVRRDYASVLGSLAADITYPRASGAVRLDRYAMTPATFSLLKLRTAYGETGILPGRLDGIPILWEARNTQYGSGITLDAIGNPDLKPERIKEWEIGLESEFLEHFAWDVTYYRQYASDSIIDKSIIPSSGKNAGDPRYNIGNIEGWGWESQLSTYFGGRSFGGWSINASLTNSYQENEVTSLGGGDPVISGPGGGRMVYWEGLPRSTYYNPVHIGAIISDGTTLMDSEFATGEGKLPDNGEVVPAGGYAGEIRSDGPIVNGFGIPDHSGSISATVSAYGFSVYGLLTWKMGFHTYNEGRVDQLWGTLDDYDWYDGIGTMDVKFDRLAALVGFGDLGNGIAPLEYGTPEYVAAANAFAKQTPLLDGNSIEPGDFIKFRELSISYNAEKLIPKLGLEGYIQGLTIGAVATNFWQRFHDDFTGEDPELNNIGYYGAMTMFQSAALPTPKTMTLFLRLSM